MVTVYSIEYDEVKQVQYVWAGEQIICPVCACAMLIKKGWRKRKLITLDGAVLTLMVCRVRCKECNKIHHVLPDIIVPYKRYDLETIEKIVQGNQNETVCEENVINRIKAWWRKFLLYISMLETSIKSKIPTPPKSGLPKAVRILANAHLWPGTRIALGLG
jgi:hypothetical protein